MSAARRAAAGGVIGPAAFAFAWWAVGRRRPGYSPVTEPISRLAAHRSSARPAMTAGFAGYAAGVGAMAAGVAGSDPWTAAALAANSASMVAVAALPLDARYGDTPHVLAATGAYVSLAVTPVLAALAARRRPAPVHAAVAAGTGALLVLSQAVPSRRGLFQRMGLSLGHLWIVARAIGAMAG